MARTKKQPLTTIISMRLSKRDNALLDEVAKSTPFLPRLTLARYALRAGLVAMRDPHLRDQVLRQAIDA